MLIATTLILAVAASLHGQPLDEPTVDARATRLVGNCANCENGVYITSTNTCYDNLAVAIYSNYKNEPLYISGRVVVEHEISVLFNTRLIGKNCGSSAKARIISRIDDDYDAIFNLAGEDGSSYHFENIRFESDGDRSRVIRTAEEDDDQMDAPDNGWSGDNAYNLNLINIDAEGFETKARGGSAVFLQVAKRVLIDNCNFLDNNVADPGEELYGGGGAVWIHEVPIGNSVTIKNSKFIGNTMEFEHGLGGAIMIGHTDGDVKILNCDFRDNAAADGGAIHIARTNTSGIVTIDSTFVNNKANEVSDGWGSRGAALRLKFIHGKVSINGVFRDNESDGRSLIANNRVTPGATVLLGGVFINNVCFNGGAIWDSHNEFGGTMIVSSDTSMRDNESEMNADTTIYLDGWYKGGEKILKDEGWVNGLSSNTRINHPYQIYL